MRRETGGRGIFGCFAEDAARSMHPRYQAPPLPSKCSASASPSCVERQGPGSLWKPAPSFWPRFPLKFVHSVCRQSSPGLPRCANVGSASAVARPKPLSAVWPASEGGPAEAAASGAVFGSVHGSRREKMCSAWRPSPQKASFDADADVRSAIARMPLGSRM